MWITEMTFPTSYLSVRGMGARAWVDESIHLDARPDGIYVLAAAISHEDRDLDDIRRQLRGLVPGRRRRLHWHSPALRDRGSAAHTLGEKWPPVEPTGRRVHPLCISL